MLVALSAGQKGGIAAVAAVFVVFALVSSFLLPRRWPDFPGRGVRLFSAVSVLLLVGMIGTMIALAKESEEETDHPPAEAQGTVTAEEGQEGGAGETTTAGGETATGAEGAEPSGEAAAGGEVFASAGCGSCHTLADAGATGTIGPNLDESQPSYELAVERVTNGQGVMPAFEGQLTDQQIRDVAAYVAEAAGS